MEDGRNGDTICDLSAGDIIPVTPDIQMSKKSRKTRKKWMCSGEPMISKEESASYMKLKSPILSTVTKVYVYHTFRELLLYSSEKYPVNNYFKIIGQYKHNQSNIPYVQGYHANDEKFSIFINMKSQQTMPKVNDVIEVFGHLDFIRIMRNDLPVIVVHFFQAIKGNISEYIYCLMKQKKFVPLNCLQLKKESDDAGDSLVDFLQNLSMSIISIGD